MYKRHPRFPEVPKDVVIWQYMSLSKFINLLKERKLYFNRIDNFKDKTECTLKAIDKKIFRFSDEAKDYWERERKRNFISCWLESNYELALMWDIYGKEGVAIKTTVGNLIKAISIDTEHGQYIARVKYVDEQIEGAQGFGEPMNVLNFPLSKRKYYEQEKEVRLLYTQAEIDDKLGKYFPVDLNKLILEVRLYPDAPQYFKDVVDNELKAAELKIKSLFSEI